MEIKPLKIPDIKLLKPKKLEDSRGYFFEAFNLLKFHELIGFEPQIVQDNQSIFFQKKCTPWPTLSKTAFCPRKISKGYSW